MADADNTIEGLRATLFDTIRELRDPENKHMDEDRAGMIAHVAHTVIATAKIEVDMVRAIGSPKMLTSFMDQTPKIEVKKTGIGGDDLQTSKMKK